MPRTKSVVEPVEDELKADVESALAGGTEPDGDWSEEDEDVPPLGFDDEAPAEDGDSTGDEAADDATEGDSEGTEGDEEDDDDEDTDIGDTGDGYQVLYNRFRPHTFASVIGQEHATGPLMDKIVRDQVGHAFLFSGDRGCGKTTTARLLAMSLNCLTRVADYEARIEDPDKFKGIAVDPEPCGHCNICKSVISGNSPVGIEELDAASNRSIGDIRNLISSMQLGSLAQRKVYIIDEVHQLSKDAVSALLKTMEEPPNGVVIILCTTDPDKIPDTIRSRVMTYRFRTLDEVTMTGLVKKIAKRAKIKVSDAEISNVVKAGRGSPRDTLSALEAINGNEEATHLNDAIVNVAESLADGEVSGVLSELAKAVNNGVAPQELGVGLISYFKNCLYALQAPTLMRVTDAERESVTIVARKLKSAKIVRLLKELSAATGKMSFSGDARVLLEVTLITVVIPEANDGILGVTDLLNDVLDLLEDLKNSGIAIPTSASKLPGWKGVDPEPGDTDEDEAPAEKPAKAKSKPEPKPEKDDEPEEAPRSKKSAPFKEDDADEDDQPEEKPVKKSKKAKLSEDDLIPAKKFLNELLDHVDEDGPKSLSSLLGAAFDDKDIRSETWIDYEGDEDVAVFTIELLEEDLERIEAKKANKNFLVEWVESKGYELELAVLKR